MMQDMMTEVPRFMADIDMKRLEKEYCDVVIIGSGIAGVYTALRISPENKVMIVTKETLDVSNSVLAQGGIAVSLDKGDSPELHFKDTIYAGAGLCDEESVWVLVREAAQNIDRLCEYGVNFDKKDTNELSLTREGAHSKNRIIHAGDTTGKEVCDKLISVVKTRENVIIRERMFVLDLVLNTRNQCTGVIVYDEDKGSYKVILSQVVICATGGYGQIYKGTTNPQVSTGDGVCMAYRAGAKLMDLEFVQFHPTVLFHPENKSFLISEAVRGEGALLRNIHGERFMPSYHELAELAPRDVVSRAIFEEMKKTESDHVYLDITFKDREWLENRFPNITKTCISYNIDIAKDYIPVAPAEHYCMGGIKTDIYGRTNIENFYACGEVACNGIHGANRLASNSLLEGLVFGNIISEQINHTLSSGARNEAVQLKFPAAAPDLVCSKSSKDRMVSIKNRVKEIMTEKVGIIRHEKTMREALDELKGYLNELKNIQNTTIEHFEAQNAVLLACLVVGSALDRKESRGAHYRVDYPYTDDINWNRNIIVQKKGD